MGVKMPLKVVIIGGGVAACEAAISCREQDPTAEIAVFGAEEIPPYRRPALFKRLAGKMPDERFFLYSNDFWEQRNITFEYGVSVSQIQAEDSVVTLSDGRKITYERLIIASGGRAFMPPWGAELSLKGLVAIRKWQECEEVLAYLEYCQRRNVEPVVAVLGAGLSGLELAEALLSLNCQVTVLEFADRPLVRQTDECIGKELLERLGQIPQLKLKVNAEVVNVLPGVDGYLSQVVMRDGSIIEAGMLISTIGMRPESDLAVAAGLKTGARGIAVDNALRSSVANIWAAGDCAMVDGVNNGLFPAAQKQGRIAGINATGGAEEFVNEPYPVRLVAFGFKFLAVGQGDGTDLVYERRDESGKIQRLLFKNDVLQMAICLDDLRVQNDLIAAVNTQINLETAITNLKLDDGSWQMQKY